MSDLQTLIKKQGLSQTDMIVLLRKKYEIEVTPSDYSYAIRGITTTPKAKKVQALSWEILEEMANEDK